MRKHAILFAIWAGCALLAGAQQRKDFRFTAAAGSTLTVVNQRGNISVKAGAGRQVTIAASISNPQIEVDAHQTGTRIEVRTHPLQRPSTEARVDYEITVPAEIAVRIDSANGDVLVENIRGTADIANDAGNVEVRSASGSVQVQTVSASVSLQNVRQTRVQLATTSGNIGMVNVSGPSVTAKSTTGSIAYTGDFSGGGTYSFTNHTGDIGVTLPANASVDLTARSVKAAVENDFPFQKKEHTAFAQGDGRSLAGTSGNGASSVELRTFSGRIRVKKQ
jgi:DUF4097 and DUF4098 domain-containing protein YvlB